MITAIKITRKILSVMIAAAVVRNDKKYNKAVDTYLKQKDSIAEGVENVDYQYKEKIKAVEESRDKTFQKLEQDAAKATAKYRETTHILADDLGTIILLKGAL